MTLPAWTDHDEWSRKRRAADTAPDDRTDPRVAGKLAELAARHKPREAQHVGRESYQSVAGRLAALEVAHESLANRHAELVAAQDQLLADNAALLEERDAWRKRAAYAEAQSPSRLGSFAAGAVSILVCLASWWGIGHLIAAGWRLVHGG